MNELQRQLTTLCGLLDRAQRYGLPVVDIERRINEVNDSIYTLRDLQRNAAIVVPVAPAQRDVVAILHNAPRCQVEESGDMLWA